MAQPDRSTANFSRHHHLFNRERINLESHQLIWLDTRVKSDEITLQSLRKIVDYTKVFDNIDECLFYIKQTNSTVTFLVCSGQLGEIFTLKVHDLNNIYAIYIYCQNKEYHQKWASKYSKIKQVHNSLEYLLNDLTESVKEYKQYENTNLFATSTQEDATTYHSPSSWWEDFIDMLVYLPYPKDYQCRLVNLLKDYYNNKEEETKILDEFLSTYKSVDAIHWYTRETFIYRVMNKALRQRNIELMFLFGFFIQDIYRQVESEYENFKLSNLKNPSIHLYRGQLISKNEIEELASSSGGCLQNNSFFSTSLRRSLAVSFLPEPSEIKGNLQRVVFEIIVDIRQSARYFADITHLSYFPHESEILFTIGTLFSKKEVLYNENENLWIITLELTNDYDKKNSKEFEISPVKFTINNSLSIITDWNFSRISSPDILNLIFNELIDLYPTHKGWILAAQYHSLAICYQYWQEGNISLSLSYCDKALKIWKNYNNDKELNANMCIGRIYKDMGFYYEDQMRDFKMCIEHYDMAINHLKLALENKISIKSIYTQMKIYQILSDTCYSKMERIVLYESIMVNDNEKQSYIVLTIKYAELCIQSMLKCYSLPNYKIAQRLEKLADVYESIKNYDDAFINYDKALRIYLELIEENPNYVYNMISKILEIYTKHRNDYHSRRKYELLKHEYTLKINAPKSTDNDYITQEKIKTIANTYEQLGDFYQSISNYNEALDYYKRALMIHQQELESHYYPISSLTEKISNIYIEHKHDYQSALEYQLLCHEYTVKQTTPDTTTDDERIIDRKKYKRGVCHIELSDFYVRIHQYDLAKKHLLIALNLYQEVQTMTLEHKIEIVNEKLKNVEKFLT